jgi:hypothetical protein
MATADRADRDAARPRTADRHHLRAQGVLNDFDDYYYFLASLGRKIESLATAILGASRTLRDRRDMVFLVA